MPRIKIETTQNVILQTELASLGDRVVAALIDYFILVIYLVVIQEVILEIGGHSVGMNGKIHLSATQYILFILIYLPAVLYFALFEYYMNGKSIGKSAMKLQVVSLNGSHLSIGQVFIRTMFRIIDVWGIRLMLMVFVGFSMSGGFDLWPVPLVGILFIAFTKKEQRIGDLAAGTVVVKIRKRATLKDTVFYSVEDNYKPIYTNVLTLSDYDVRAIKEAIMLAERYNNFKYAKELAVQVKKHLQINKKVPATTFLKTILKDYNYLANKAA